MQNVVNGSQKAHRHPVGGRPEQENLAVRFQYSVKLVECTLDLLDREVLHDTGVIDTVIDAVTHRDFEHAAINHFRTQTVVLAVKAKRRSRDVERRDRILAGDLDIDLATATPGMQNLRSRSKTQPGK